MVGVPSSASYLGELDSALLLFAVTNNMPLRFGDIIDCFMAMMVYRSATKVEGGLPANVKSKMLFNIVVDFAIGLVPLLGDVAGEHSLFPFSIVLLSSSPQRSANRS